MRLAFLGAIVFSLTLANSFAGDSGVMKLTLPDAAAVGMGTAFTGEADRPSAVYYNPAGIVQVGRAFSAGVTTVLPQLDYKSPSGETVQARRTNFTFPHVYFTTPLVDNKFYIGIGENSNFGAGYSWSSDVLGGSTNPFTRYSMVHDEFVNQDIMLVGAYKVNDQLSFGVGAIDDNSRIEKQKKLFQSGANDDGDSQLKARDNAWGYSLSSLFKINEQHQVGLTYKSPIQHTYKGKLYLNELNNNGNPFGLGAGVGWQAIFGGTSFETNASYKVTMPQSVTLGYSFKPSNKLIINFDLEWTDWSRTEQSIISFPDANTNQALILATNNPQSRDWKSVWSEALGAEYAATDSLRLRLGYVHHQSPIGNDTWDTSFPDATSNSVTTGFGYDLTQSLVLDFAYVAVFYDTRKVSNTVDSGFGANLNGTYDQFVNISTATLTYKF